MLDRLKQSVSNPDLGRLSLRVFMFGTLFLKHGSPKLFGFQAELVGYPNVFHLGPVLTLMIATFADGICSMLIVLGFATRWAVLYAFCNFAVGWGMVHGFAVLGTEGRVAEQITIYLAGCVAVFCLGAGKYSIDGLIATSEEKKRVAGEFSSPARTQPGFGCN